MFSKIFSVAVVVSDGKKAAKWYKEKLGFEVSIENEHWITAWPKGSQCMIHLCEGELEPGNTGIAFYTDDLKGAIAALKKKGVKFSKDYTKESWGEFAMFDDPDGNSFWLQPGSP